MNGEGRYPAPDTLQGAKEAFYRERASELQNLGGPALERRLRDAHAPAEVLQACEKGMKSFVQALHFSPLPVLLVVLEGCQFLSILIL